ncbi:MAG TPA: UdgX family uracil-DNA binding protein [Caldimonas sp.]
MTADERAPFPTAQANGAAPASSVHAVRLASAVDFAGFRRACRTLWSQQVAPDRVGWTCADDAEIDLFVDARGDGADAPSAAPAVRVPPAFLPLAESAILHCDPDRFALLYRLLWRLQIEAALRTDPLDADWLRADEMAQAVRRDLHRMKASVRFRAIAEPDGEGAIAAPLHLAWFEPEHHIVEASAPFFARRYSAMRWAILTPERSVRWDGVALAFGPGARREGAPGADAPDQLWLACYRTVFDPTRLALATMQPQKPERDQDPAMRSTSQQPRTLAVLGAALQNCRECPIGEHATQAVGGEGSRHARLMFVGEQPGDQEDLQGRPFVGPAGQVLARALDELGIPRDQVYITNAVKHFKFELRGRRRIHKTPAQQEASACLHWLESEIALVDPGALVALGATAARQLLGGTVSVLRERGRWLVRRDGRRVLITLHPSALLRMEPEDKAAAYAAWLADLRHAADHFEASADAMPRR